ncbi:MAG: hypothetical protein JNK04_20405 [Myxococcales bacterium]|nr:hypothetical protein [Myxococcales bacterium]
MSITSKGWGRNWLKVGLLGAILVGSTGCGALGALSNPKAAWALDEPAPMSVVVRRAEIASMTAQEVDRLLSETGLDDDSAWVGEMALKKDEAKTILERIAADETYAAAAKGGKLRVAPAEAWYAHFSGICTKESDHENLLTATSAALGDAYKDLTALHEEIAKLKAEKTELETASKAKGANEADFEKRIDEQEAKIEKAEDAVGPKEEAFLKSVREEASKADDATKKRVAVALVNLRRAVDDAKTMNSVALLRYPLAVTSLQDDVQRSAKRVVGDVIEEQTGKRPDLGSLKPEVKIDGTDVKLTLAGLTASELLSMKPDEVIEETTLRLTNYVGRVLTLVAFADETQNRLSFQSKVLDAWIEGMKITPGADAGDDLDLVVDTTSAKKDKAEGTATKLRHTHGGVRTTKCEATRKDVAVAVADPEPGPQKKAPAKKGAVAAAPKSQPSKPAKPTSSAPVSESGQGPLAAPAPSAKGDKPCDLVVENASGSYCL